MNFRILPLAVLSITAIAFASLGACGDDTTNTTTETSASNSGGSSASNGGGGSSSDGGGGSTTTSSSSGDGGTGGIGGGTGGTGGTGGSGGSGGSGGGCASPAECPPPANECQTVTCVANQCGTENVAAGTATVTQTPADCKRSECDGAGAVVDVNDDADLPVDNNACTSDVCTAGVPTNPPLASGTSCGGVQVCDGSGNCVGCVTPATCPGQDDDCKTRTCVGGTCGQTFAPQGTPTGTQTTGDCKENQCDGNGNSGVTVDDADLPVDGNDCTDDLCSNGNPSNPPLTVGTPCPGGICNAAAQCVGCITPADCPGSDTECQVRTCQTGTCGVNNTPLGFVTSAQTSGNCTQNQCDGIGNIVAVPDLGDVPVDGNQCTSDLCVGGAPSNPPVAAGTACTQAGGFFCDGATVCTRSVDVVRVGDGSAALGSAATAVFLEERFVSNGALVPKGHPNPLPMPTLATAVNARLTMSGSASSEGALSTSLDGRFVVLAGYDAQLGTAGIASTTSATVNRIPGRVDALGNIDTSTRINALISGNNVRAAATDDGSRFWVGGGANGAVFITLGATGGTSLNATPPTNLRTLNVFAGQLYGSSNSGAFTNVFTIGTGLPTTSGQTATSFPGMPVTGTSYFAFLLLDLNNGVPGVDTLYVADDRASPNGGIQKWTFDGATWTLQYTLNQVDPGTGTPVYMNFRGVTGYAVGTRVTIIGSQPAALAVFVDDGLGTSNGVQIAAAGTNTGYRGVSNAPR